MKSIITLCLIISLVSSTVVRKWHSSADGSLYFIEPQQKFNWFEAWSFCMRKNMTLLAIDTYEKHIQIDALLKTLSPTACPPLWVSGHDNAVEHRYEWASTGEEFTFTNWAPNEPNRVGNAEHCLIIYIAWSWHDASCNAKYGFICEENRFLKELSKKLNDMEKKVEDKVKSSCNNYSVYIGQDSK